MTDYVRIAKAIEYIKLNITKQPSLNEIAEAVHLSPYHFQRIFSQWAGVSPKKFLQFLSLQHAKEVLKQGATLLDATYETGLSGTGRLHDLFVSIEGMTPGEYKNDGEKLEINYSVNTCHFGNYLVASTNRGVCNLFFFEDSQDMALQELRSSWKNSKLTAKFDLHQDKVKRFFENDFRQPEMIKLHLKGTEFQIKVWEALLRIPEGALSSYSDISKLINKPSAQRAVGTAIGSNPVGYLIPCHRVIKSVGGIGEYRWGSTRKMAMIGWEAGKSWTETFENS